MISDIKNEYKNKLKEVKFSKFYWATAFFIILIPFLVFLLLSIASYFMVVFYILFIIIIILYMHLDYCNTIKKSEINSNDKFRKKFQKYKEQNRINRIDNLIQILKKYNCKSKSNMLLLINTSNSRQPVHTITNIRGWIISTAISLASIAEMAYNDATKKIDYEKLGTVLSSVIGITLYLLFIVIILRIFLKSIYISNKEIYSQLSEDLNDIYINYDQYKNKLYEK